MINSSKLIVTLAIAVFVLFRIYDKERASGKTGASLIFKILMTAIIALFPLAFVFIGVSNLFLCINHFDSFNVVLGLFFTTIGAWLTYLTIKKSKDFDKNFR